MWLLGPWIPLNSYFLYLYFADNPGVGYAWPIIFVSGFVGSAFTFLILDIFVWNIFYKNKQILETQESSIDQIMEEAKNYQWSDERIKEEAAKRGIIYSPEND